MKPTKQRAAKTVDDFIDSNLTRATVDFDWVDSLNAHIKEYGLLGCMSVETVGVKAWLVRGGSDA